MSRSNENRAEKARAAAAWVDDLKAAFGLNQDEFGKAVDLCGSTVSRWGKGLTAPEVESLRKIAATFHIPIPVEVRDAFGMTGEDAIEPIEAAVEPIPPQPDLPAEPLVYVFVMRRDFV